MAKANSNNNQDSQTTALEQKRKELIADILKLRDEERSALAKGIELSKKEKQGLNSKTKQLKKIVELVNEENKAIQSQVDNYKDAESSISSMSKVQEGLKEHLKVAVGYGADFATSIGQASNKNKEAFKNAGTAAANALTAVSELAGYNREDTAAIAAKNQEINNAVAELKSQLSLTEAKGESAESADEALIANLLMQISLIEKGQQEASKFANISKETKELYEELTEDLESINKTFKKVATTAEIFFSSFQNGLGLAFLGAGHLFEKFEEINSQIGGWGFQLGGFKLQAMLVTEILGEEAGKATISLGQKLGNVNDVALGTSLNAGFLAHNLGLSGDEAAGVITQFGRLQGLSNDTGLNMAAATKELALQNNVAPRQVMQDIAKNGEAFALFSKDGGKNMAEAAVAAAKLGSDLGTASKMSENLLDYNSSVEKEMNASVLLGRDLNLGKARELAYAGDIAGAQREALEAAGGVQEFNKMDYYQKKAVADALGVSVQELQTMGANMEHNNTLTGELEGTFSSLNEGAEALTGTFGGTLLKGIGGALIGVKGMKENIADAKEGASFLKDSFTGIKGLFSGKGMKGFGGILESKEQKSIGSLGDKLGGKGAAPATGGKGPSEAMKGGSKINMNDAIKGAAAMLIMAAAIFVLAKALQEFNTVEWSSLAKAGVALIGLGIAMWVITKMLTPLVESGILFIVAAGVLIFAAALYVMGAGAKLFAEAFALISTSLSAFANGLSGLDVGKLALLGLALIPLGIGLMTAAPGLIIGSVGLMLLANAMAALAPALSLLSTVMPAIVANLTPLVGMIMQIFGLAAAITTLSLSLAMLGTMGILALPILAALGGGGLMKILGGGEGGAGGTGGDSSQKLLDEIVGLRQDMTDGKIAVYLDGKKMNTGLAISNKRQPS
jgi:hypothetical protein